MQDEENNCGNQYCLLSPYFDGSYYINRYIKTDQINPDDPLEHYINIGSKKGYSPNKFFDGKYYLEQNKDIAEAGLNSLAHYLEYGYEEGRAPRSDASVLKGNPDLDILDSALNFKRWRLPCIIDGQKISENASVSDLADMVNATQATATILYRDSDDWLIAFSGRNEHFFYLNKMQHFWGNVLFLRDTSSTYYSQNPDLPAVESLSMYIDYLTGPRIGRTILLGQSSGGHAALYQSSFVRNSITLSFSPQTYHPDLYPNNIYFEKSINKMIPAECAADLIKHLKESPDASRYVISGKSESSHEDSYYWGDAVSAGLIASTGKCSVIIVNRKEHPTIQYLDTAKMFALLHDNYDVFINNSRKASQLFCAAELYYE